MSATDEKVLTYTIADTNVGGYVSKAGIATGELILRATDAESAQKALALLLALAPAFVNPTLTATIQIGDAFTTYKFLDTPPEIAAQWIAGVAVPMAAKAFPAAPPAPAAQAAQAAPPAPAAPAPADAAEQAQVVREIAAD